MDAPIFEVLRGRADDEECAALAAVLLVLSQRRRADPGPAAPVPAARWAAADRFPVFRPAGSWKS